MVESWNDSENLTQENTDNQLSVVNRYLSIRGIHRTIRNKQLTRERKRKRALVPLADISDESLDERTADGLKIMQSELEMSGHKLTIK